MANPSHDKGNITDAEIAGYMGWRGPGAYTEASLRKIREIIDHVLRVERATPPSPSTAPMCERKTAKLEEEGYAKTGYVLRQPGKDREVVVSDGGAVSWFTTEQWHWLMFNRDHVEFNWPKPIGARLAPSTAPEVDERAAFEAWAGPKQLSLRRTTSADHGLYVEQYTRDAWDAWQGRAALASRPAEVDDEGLPALPRPVWWYGGTDPYFSAEQYRQGQRDAVAAYKRKQAALQELADQAQENDMGYGAAPSHTTNKENG